MRWRHNETLASRATARCSGCFHQYGVYATSLYAAATRLTSTACANCRSPELAAVIASEAVARTQVIKKLWDYIKEHGLQDAKDKRSINADATFHRLRQVNPLTCIETDHERFSAHTL